MKCYVCGGQLNAYNVCPQCGADVLMYKRIISKSNSLYNEGLEKAKVRDLSGAVICLQESLRLYKKNTYARNLLGLVYFEMGEAVLALSEWIISRNYDGGKDNLANLYIEKLQSNQAKLNTINETLKKYNQALQYCYQGSYDLAAIQLKKVLSINERLISGYQLLALIYMETEEYEKARRTLLRSLRIDANNTRTLTYLKETNRIIKEIEEQQNTDGKKGKKKARPSSDVYSYEVGNDVIIQPVYEKEKAGFSSVINILLGILVGVGICYLLILPARIDKKTQEFEQQFIEVSDQLAEEQAKHNQDIISLDSMTKERDELKSKVADLTGASGKVRPLDYLLQAATKYVENGDNSSAVMELLDNITEDELAAENADFNALYYGLKDDTGPRVIEAYVEAARAAMKSSDYEEAVKQYEKAYELDKTNSDILMNLAHAYRQKGDVDTADKYYRQIMSEFPESENAQDAAEYITNQ
ncbi:MAG: tetratricopeptide repeat protein [Lachnospiraceae bacterium]|nr:tetratricopeptide repeat protein [Lachnospiraceae bacterium]